MTAESAMILTILAQLDIDFDKWGQLIFIAAFLPQFIDTARPLGLQFALIVPTFLVITFTVTSVWALVAGKVSGVLRSQQAFQSVLRTARGLMIISEMGLGLARRGN